jgi:hypothetical protein
MMHLQFGDGGDLGRRSRLFAALTSYILPQLAASKALGHTVRQIRYRVNELSSPSGDYEVFFTEAGKTAVSTKYV